MFAVQVSEQFFEDRTRLDRRRLVKTGQQRSHDVLAPAAPIVGATAYRIGDAALIKGDAHLIGHVLASLDLGLNDVAALHQRDHSALPVIVLPPAERLGGGLLADGGFAQSRNCHFSHFPKIFSL